MQKKVSIFGLYFLLSLLCFTLFSACSKKNPPKNEKQDEYPHAIISLSPAATEILFAIGAEKQIVAISDFSDYPPETQNLPKIGGFDGKTLSFEKILSFNPDFLYLTNGMHNFLIEQLQQNSIKYYLSDATSVSKIFQEILELGEITGNQNQAQIVVQNMQNQIENIKKKQKNNPPAVYYEVWNEPFMSCGSTSFINDIITLSGGKNIFAQLEQSYPIVSEETIIASNPDFILLPKSSLTSANSVKLRNGWENLNAVKNNQIYIIDDDLLCRPGPRVTDSIQQLSDIFSKNTDFSAK